MDIVILGGGISGLSAAWYGKKQHPEANVIVLEREEVLGGWMQTRHEEGFLFEKGPRTFQAARCPHLLELIEEMGLSKDLIFSDPLAAKRYVLHQGKLKAVGSFWLSIAFALLRSFFVKKGVLDDESIYDFSVRRFGKAMTETLVDALAIGIFAGDIKKLSIRSCFPFLLRWEQNKGSFAVNLLTSRSKGVPKGLFTLREGMGSLIAALAHQSGAQVICGAKVEAIEKRGVWAGGRFYLADRIISALPGNVLSPLLGVACPFEMTDFSIAHLGFEGDLLPRKGFGYLVPTREKEILLGMIWDSSVFPQQNQGTQTRVSAMLRRGGLAEAKEAMARHLGVTAEPVFSACATGTIPQFTVGYEKRLEIFRREVLEKYPTLRLAGNYLVGASIEACVSLSKRVVKSLL